MATKKNGLPFGIGDKIFVRTVTHYLLGEVSAIESDVIVLAKASWVADTGRWAQCLKDGSLNEVELCDSEWACVSRGSIVDIHPWRHALPTATK